MSVDHLEANQRYVNRELSWLEFNQRVLEEALDDSKPLLERVKFLAITASNLDEFFMVRVGGLKLLVDHQRRDKDLTGATPHQQLRAIRERTRQMMTDQADLWKHDLVPLLEEEGIEMKKFSELRSAQREHISNSFRQNFLPLITPVGVELEGDYSSVIPNLSPMIAVELADMDQNKEESRLALVALPRKLPRMVAVPFSEDAQFLLLEDLICAHLGEIFPGEQVCGTAVFRVTRNGDIVLRDEDSMDLAEDMEELLFARSQSGTVRLEIQYGASRSIVQSLRQLCGVENTAIFRSSVLLDLKALFAVASLSGYDHLKGEAWTSVEHPDFDTKRSIFEQIAEEDLLVHHPFQSFEPVVRLVEEAAQDPDVLGIKQILYRTASNSRIVDALIRAAEAGKQVTVLVELKARFDEARNLARAEELRRAGAHIIYGVKGLKTHAKICLVLRSEAGRIVRYCHFGTGNYNESTAKLYTDVSLLTCRTELGEDASGFFNAVAGRCRPPKFASLYVAPSTLKPRILELLESESAAAKQGSKAFLRAKLNSLQDKEVIDALYAASKAGVKIELIIRGVCCLKPGVKGLSDNIRVISIIDAYLEHSRILHAYQGGRNAWYISSADWMSRNLDKRVELLVPVEDKKAKKRLDEILTLGLEDNAQASQWTAAGTYLRLRDQQKSGTKLLRSQEELTRRARRAASARNQARQQGILDPHLPKE